MSFKQPLLISDRAKGARLALQDLTPAIKSNGNSSGCACDDRLVSGCSNGMVPLYGRAIVSV